MNHRPLLLCPIVTTFTSEVIDVLSCLSPNRFILAPLFYTLFLYGEDLFIELAPSNLFPPPFSRVFVCSVLSSTSHRITDTSPRANSAINEGFSFMVESISLSLDGRALLFPPLWRMTARFVDRSRTATVRPVASGLVSPSFLFLSFFSGLLLTRPQKVDVGLVHLAMGSSANPPGGPERQLPLAL